MKCAVHLMVQAMKEALMSLEESHHCGRHRLSRALQVEALIASTVEETRRRKKKFLDSIQTLASKIVRGVIALTEQVLSDMNKPTNLVPSDANKQRLGQDLEQTNEPVNDAGALYYDCSEELACEHDAAFDDVMAGQSYSDEYDVTGIALEYGVLLNDVENGDESARERAADSDSIMSRVINSAINPFSWFVPHRNASRTTDNGQDNDAAMSHNFYVCETSDLNDISL